MEKVIEIGTYILGVYTFLFAFWRKLKEDYLPTQIFTSALISVATLFLFMFSLGKLDSTWWFWWAFFGSILGLLAAIYKFNLKLFETLEAWVCSDLISLTVIFMVKSIVNKELNYILIFIFVLLLYIFYKYLSKNYKKFTWYKSGKVGFAGISVFALFFLCRFVVALFYPNMLSFVGHGELLLSGGMFLIAVILYTNLAKQIK